VQAVCLVSKLQWAIAERLNLLDLPAKLLQRTLVLGAGLTRAVAEVVDGVCLGIWLSVGLGDSRSESLSCTLGLGAGLTRAVAPVAYSRCSK